MRTIDDAFAAHLAGDATTLATCWRLERRDGLVLGFTDHDEALSFGGTQYRPTHGLDGGETPARLGAQVDTGEVLGVLSDQAIGEADIAQGRWDGAEVQTWRVNWQAPEQRLQLRTDTIGEIVREDGVFRAELRSGQQALNAVRGRVYGSLCDAQLGDGRCRVALDTPARRGLGTVLAVVDATTVAVSGLGAFEPGWFAFGSLRWTAGQRDGVTDGVVAHRVEAGTVLLTANGRMDDWVQPGDAFVVSAGCDRRFATCRDKFDNSVNFRGFPHIPGSDYVLRHPRQGDALDGKAVVP